MLTGREGFRGRRNVAPLEFQNVKSSAEALDTGKAFMRELIRMAGARGISTWISFDSAFVPLNMAKYLRRMSRPVELYSALVSFTDPVAHEINRRRIESIVEAYPDIEGILFQITEGFYDDPYPESKAVIEREWPNYAEAFALFKKHWGKWWTEDPGVYHRADIGFVELLKKSIASAKEISPNLRLGVMTVCKAYLLTYLDKILPKDMPFVDIEAGSLWTPDGAPLHLFKRMKGRECVLVPRAYDDGSFAGLQFNLRLYEKDGFVKSSVENHTRGMAIQTTHFTGNDHNVRFLAEGMWNPTLTPEEFYPRYAASVFGPRAAGPAVEVFSILEENETFLGGRGLKNMPYSLNPLETGILRAFKTHPDPFFLSPYDKSWLDQLAQRSVKFEKAIEYLKQTLPLLKKVKKSCRQESRKDAEYHLQKTHAYISHLQTLILLRSVHETFNDAFAARAARSKAGPGEFGAAARLSEEAEKAALATAEQFAACGTHPTDLGILWMMNHVAIAARILRQYIGNVRAYHEGREYWKQVDWHLFSDTSPFPVNNIAGLETLVLG
jgi:hypothetical protein